MDIKTREKKIVQTSIVGIAANLLLAGFKAFIGIISNSVAITMDAVNNVTDATSSIITIVGTKLASKRKDYHEILCSDGYGCYSYRKPRFRLRNR